MSTRSFNRKLWLIGALVLSAILLAIAAAGSEASIAQPSGQPTLPEIYTSNDGKIVVTFTWTRQIPGNGAWLGTMKGVQEGNTLLNKPIQVFDATNTNPVVRQFQAQDGSFYCRKMEIPNNKNYVSWSGCRNFPFADQTFKAQVLGEPTRPRLHECDIDDRRITVRFNWTRQMPGSGAWLGTINVSQGVNTVLSKPIQVFDATNTDPVVRQFQAQDGSFYCRKMEIPKDKSYVSWSECRNFLLADQTCTPLKPTPTPTP